MKKIATIITIMFMVLCVTSCDFYFDKQNNGNFVQNETDTAEVNEPDSMVQCVAITKAGTQCQRLVFYPDTLCFQHRRMLIQSDSE